MERTNEHSNSEKVMARCPKCGQAYNQTDVIVSEHHILPRSKFGDRGATICLCRRDHDALEKRIPTDRKLSETAYFLIVSQFLFS